MMPATQSARESWLRGLRRCTSRAVESPSVPGSLLVVSILERAVDYSFPAPLWHCVTVGIVAWAATFWIPVLTSTRVGERPWREWAMVGSYVVAALVFAVVTYWGLAPHAPADHPEATLLGRITVIAPSRLAIWLGATFLADASERIVARRRALTASAAELDGLMAAAQATVHGVPDEAARGVRAALAAEVANLRVGRGAEVQTKLYALIENVVRPLSQRLAVQVPQWQWAGLPGQSDTRGTLARQLLDQIVPRIDLLPGLTSALYGVLTTLPAVVTLGVQHGVMAVLGVAVCAYLATALARIVPLQWYPKGPYRALLALVVRAAGIGTFSGSVMLLLALGHPHARVLALQSGATVFVVSLALGLASAGARVIVATDEQVAAANASIAWRVARLQAQRWVTQHALAMKLHGSVQSAMQACLLRLRSLTSDRDVEEVLGDLESSLDLLLAEPDAQPPVLDQLRNIEDTWRGIADVSWWVTDQDAVTIDADAVCATLVQSVVQDSVSNAVRHGGATSVTIDIEVMDDTACLTITNDGEADDGARVPGFGTAQLEACAISWERHLDAQPRTLHALLPLAVTAFRSSTSDAPTS